jgi:hypothetical protein
MKFWLNKKLVVINRECSAIENCKVIELLIAMTHYCQFKSVICFSQTSFVTKQVQVRERKQYLIICCNTKRCVVRIFKRGSRGRDRMVVGFTTTYTIGAYHHWCEFESRSGRGVQHYVIKFVSDLWQVGGFLRVLWFPPPIKLTATI